MLVIDFWQILLFVFLISRLKHFHSYLCVVSEINFLLQYKPQYAVEYFIIYTFMLI